MSMAQGASGPPPAGWAQPTGAGPREGAFSPGNREECRDGTAVPVRGAEDRATDTCPTRTILFLVQALHLTGEETETYGEGGI